MVRWLILLLFATMVGCALPKPDEIPPADIEKLSWTGQAIVQAGDRTLTLGIDTQVVPFRSARSDSWLSEQGRSIQRSLIIEPTGGWIERAGARTPMDPLMLIHERQQYAVYGQMLEAMRRAKPGGRVVIVGDGVGSVDTAFQFDAAGRLTEARNSVADSTKPGVYIPQIFRFAGELRSNGVRWPRRIEIEQGGKPYFILELARFTAR